MSSSASHLVVADLGQEEFEARERQFFEELDSLVGSAFASPDSEAQQATGICKILQAGGD